MDAASRGSDMNNNQREESSDKWLIIKRILAFILDRIIAVLIILAGIPVVIAGESFDLTELEWITKIIFFLLLGLAVTYAYARDMIGGRSLGRRILSQQVVDIYTNKPISGWKSLLREIPTHFAPLLAIELILIITNQNHRRIGDQWANSIVISTKKGA
ncbi:MAG: hypothetical protein APR63_14145 [Desulfuromonas sp. SDB]|nr:MAG: hypothetical protein APR63_14145 [Desulfuromonas sp. SDB]